MTTATAPTNNNTSTPPSFTSSSSIVSQVVPVGSFWMRTKGKHSGRQIRVASTSNRGVKVELIGRQYQSRQLTGKAVHPEAHVPFDMFLLLYSPQDPLYSIPSRADVHIWHTENGIKCNCPMDIRAMADTKLTAMRVKQPLTSKPKPQPKPTLPPPPSLESTPAIDIEAITTPEPEPEEQLTTSEPEPETKRYPKRGVNIADETLGLLAAFYRDNPDVSIDEMIAQFGISNGTIYRAIKKFNVPNRSLSRSGPRRSKEEKLQERREKARNAYRNAHPPKIGPMNPEYWTSERRAAKSEQMKRFHDSKRQTAPDQSQPLVIEEDFDTTVPILTLIPTPTPTPEIMVTTPTPSSTPSPSRKWNVYVVREQMIEVEAPTLLDALAKADADPANVDVIGVMPTTHHSNLS